MEEQHACSFHSCHPHSERDQEQEAAHVIHVSSSDLASRCLKVAGPYTSSLNPGLQPPLPGTLALKENNQGGESAQLLLLPVLACSLDGLFPQPQLPSAGCNE